MSQKVPWWKQKTLAEALGKPAPAPAARKLGKFGGVVLREDSVSHRGEVQPLAGVSARVESGSALDKRLTGPRLAMLGPFALLAKKSKGGESYLTIEGPEFAWVVEVDRDSKAQRAAREFAALVCNAGKHAMPSA